MTDKVKSGRLGTSANTHLYTVPYSKTAPQAAMPVPGDGSAAGRVQYYGALSGDDKYIAYNELDATTANNQHAALDQMDLNAGVTLDGMYAQPKTEVFVIQTQRRDEEAPRGERSAPVPGPAGQPRHQQQLAEVVAPGRNVG